MSAEARFINTLQLTLTYLQYIQPGTGKLGNIAILKYYLQLEYVLS